MNSVMQILWEDVKKSVWMFFLFAGLFAVISLPLIFMNWFWPDASTDGKVISTAIFWVVIGMTWVYVMDVRDRARVIRRKVAKEEDFV